MTNILFLFNYIQSKKKTIKVEFTKIHLSLLENMADSIGMNTEDFIQYKMIKLIEQEINEFKFDDGQECNCPDCKESMEDFEKFLEKMNEDIKKLDK